MITNADVTKLKEVFATKDELSELRADMAVEFGEVHEKMDTIATAIGRIENTLDDLAGAIQDQRIENGAGMAHLLRHDRQIDALAQTAGVTLPN
jgi:predicted  nucleic acid-binding Zn-ribbon protein